MAEFYLHIDESGSSFPTYQVERPYSLVGCAIAAGKKAELKNLAAELKIKYWKTSDVVLHHADIASNGKDFSIFRRKPELKQQFQDDLLEFLRKAPIVAFVAIVDKKKITDTWKEETIITKTARATFFNFISFLYSQPHPSGKIIIEAATSTKDVHYLKAFSHFLSPDCPELDEDFGSMTDIRKVLSSLSYVTKHNNDIETQIADIFGYAAYCQYQLDRGGQTFKKGSYEQKLLTILNMKLFKLHPQTSSLKRKFFSKVIAFKYLPN